MVESARLAEFLNLSFEQWQLGAQASAMGARAPIEIWLDGVLQARLGPLASSAPGQRDAQVEGREIPPVRWLLETHSDDAPTPLREEIRSLSGLLLALRQRLDPGFTPGRALIGTRPMLAPVSAGPRPEGPSR